MDLQLPRIDGWQLTREIKQNPATAHVAIVVVSACVMPAEREAAREAGYDAFIAKPCDPLEIVAELRRHAPAP
jgi:CheY-like chemotaxis protein